MQVSIKTTDPQASACDLLALPILRRTRGDRGTPILAPTARAIDRALGGIVSAAIQSGDFRANAGQATLLYPAGSSPVQRVLLIGLGNESNVTAESLRRAAGTAVRRAGRRRTSASRSGCRSCGAWTGTTPPRPSRKAQFSAAIASTTTAICRRMILGRSERSTSSSRTGAKPRRQARVERRRRDS